jgi:cytochrome P450
MRKQIQDIIDGRNQGYKDVSHPTVFKELLDSDLPASEKSIQRLEDEGITVVGAGQETVKLVLTLLTFHLLGNPEIMERLRQEIIAIFPDPASPPDLTKLEQLPYLSAVIQEGQFRRPPLPPSIRAHPG